MNFSYKINAENIQTKILGWEEGQSKVGNGICTPGGTMVSLTSISSYLQNVS